MMDTKKKPAIARRIIGDILIFLVLWLTIETIMVMSHKISAVVLKADYIAVFRYELIFCAIVLGLALENGQPTKALELRLDTGEEYLVQYPEYRQVNRSDSTGCLHQQ